MADKELAKIQTDVRDFGHPEFKRPWGARNTLDDVMDAISEGRLPRHPRMLVPHLTPQQRTEYLENRSRKIFLESLYPEEK
jgi:hypothetical protein